MFFDAEIRDGCYIIISSTNSSISMFYFRLFKLWQFQFQTISVHCVVEEINDNMMHQRQMQVHKLQI